MADSCHLRAASQKAETMGMHALITGGAGFIGSHLADLLLSQGHRVRVLDNLVPQVHGPTRRPPSYLSGGVDLYVGDVREPKAVAAALQGVDCVFHLAALVGVGQSMYQVADYVDVNVRGTAVLLEALVKHPVKRLVVASSMSVYGEGAYVDDAGRRCAAMSRPLEQLRRGDWELTAHSGARLVPSATDETKPTELESVYALTKFDQERLCLVLGRAYSIPTVALRFFNVFGPRQALSNPYTGVLAIFSSRLLNNQAPLLFEDGEQRRDFVSVRDVTRACLLALERDDAVGQVFNVGSGQSRTILSVARDIAKLLGKRIEPELTGKYRVGDIRHCFADISRAEQVLGYRPRVAFADGLAELGHHLDAQVSKGQIARDRTLEARRELDSRGLTL
jgi:dTDP-L-rhamnose 4-epimerase